MGWRFRKSKSFGPFLVTLTHRGITTSVGAGGLRYKLSGPGKKRNSNGNSSNASSTSPLSILGALAGLGVVGVGGVIALAVVISFFSGGNSTRRSTSASAPNSSQGLAAASSLTDSQQISDSSIPAVGAIPPTAVNTAHGSGVDSNIATPLSENSSPPTSPVREWTSLGGKYTTCARLLDFRADTAYLQKEEAQKIVSVLASKLSAADQEYLAAQCTDSISQGTVTGVQEGDIVTVSDGRSFRVRLVGIDAPEKGQPHFEESRANLLKRVYQKGVKVEWKNKDNDGVLLGNLIVDGHWVNRDLVEDGSVWEHNGGLVLADAQATAKGKKAGLWSEFGDPIAPWEYSPTPSPKKVVAAKPEPTLDAFRSPSTNQSRSTFEDTPAPSRSTYYGSGTGDHTATGIPIHTGPRGGRYHYSKNGKKVYEKKKK